MNEMKEETPFNNESNWSYESSCEYKTVGNNNP